MGVVVPPSSARRRSRSERDGRRWARARRGRFAGRTITIGALAAVLAGAGAGVALEGPLGWTTPTTDLREVARGDGGAAPAVTGPFAGVPEAHDGAVEPSAPAAAEPTPEVPVAEPVAPVVDGLSEVDRAAGLLSFDVPQAGTGNLVVVPGEEAAPATERRVLRVRVEVEEGLPIDAPVFSALVMATLNDARGWGGDGSVSFARTAGDADVRVVLATPATVDALCAPLRTHGIYSCGRNGHAALNYMRWVQGADEFTDLMQYRQYLVNHEVGHLLGRPHVGCPAAGELAPVMQQQTIQVAPCVPNGWPFPGGA